MYVLACKPSRLKFDQRFTTFRHIVLALLLPVALGCEPKQEVRVYKAPKQVVAVAQLTAQPKRSLAAIIPHGSKVFYLKAMEAPERLETLVVPLTELVKSVTFSASGLPVWKLPEGWQEKAGTGMSIAILEAPVPEKSVPFAVTQLDLPPGDWDGYLESNLNRWRNQLALPPLPLAEQKPSLIELTLDGEARPAYIVDLVGTSAGGGMGGPMSGGPMSGGPMSGGPMSGGPMSGGPMSGGPAAPSQAEEKSPLEYKVPEGWVDAGAGPFRLATFKIVEGEASGEVTLSAAKSDLKGNAIMWQSQLMQQDAKQEAIEEQATASIEKGEPIKSLLGAGTLYLFRASGEEDAMSLLIAEIPIEGAEASLFVKLKGPGALVTNNRAKLIEFVASFNVKR